MKPQPLINVSDVQRSARFYCQLLAAEPGHGGEEFEQVLVGNELVLQIHGAKADANHDVLVETEAPVGNGVVLWFETDDFTALLARIGEHGITLDREPYENPFARQMECWLHDPDCYQVVIAGPSAWTRTPLSQQTNDTGESP